MLILLPPSEGKAAPRRRGRPVDLDALPFPELTPTRLAVRAALREVSGRPDALQLLGVGAGLLPEVRQNLALPTSAGLAAASVYTGVLYDALDYGSLSAGAKRRANRSLRVQSALWGPVGPGDRVAPYRLSMATSLPGLGPLAAVWRPVLAGPMASLAGDGVVVDCRSAAYAAAWLPAGDAARRLVGVRVLTQGPGGLTVVSHLAKHTRGLVARLLLEWPERLATPRQVAAAVGGTYRCELVDLGRRGFRLDVIG
ncbi:YaaA family protein [uncultured Friedmanniella sp.]|uniref:YaaA family protein n=1 Tax=uncultured Friedmanniella sp. TaxID=335381 RepID=UPI0035CAA489